MKLILLATVFCLALSTIEIFGADNAGKFIESESERLILITTTGEESDAAKAVIEQFDAENTGVLISNSDTEDKEGLADRLADYVGVSISKAPHLIFYDTTNNKYLFDQKYTLENLKGFVESVRENRIKQHIKSAEIPTYTDEDVFQVVVGNNWVDEVINNGKETLAYIYAPWCGHCKTFAPIFEKLAKQFQGNKNVKFVKVDATANDLPQFPAVQGFPTIAYFPKGGDQPYVMYEGDRSESDIVKFVKDNTQFEWVEPGTQAEEDL